MAQLPHRTAAPARQRLRMADGRHLLTTAQGEWPDLVVLEAGLGAAGASWGGVLDALLPRLAPRGRVVAYDRAGYGGSDPAPGPRDLAALAADLLAVVESFPYERLVLVGHSWGGPIVRLVAAALREREEDVAGLVLVDPAEELADLYFTRTTRLMNRVPGAVLPALARLRLLAHLQRSAAASLPAAHRGEAAAAVSTLGYARAVRAESAHITRGLQGLRLAAPDPLGVPLTVLSGRLPEGLGRRTRDELTEAHRRRAEREAGSLLEAERSGHVIGASEPQLIADEILRLLG